MDDEILFELMVDLHRDGARQGPGSETDTLRALEITGLDADSALRVADIGCGTGAASLVLAGQSPRARIVAVDLFPAFLDVLQDRAKAAGCGDRIEVRAESMDALTFAPESLDLIWSEGAIYTMGFRRGLEEWRAFLRPGGVVAVSELSWLRRDPPEEIARHWNAEYPEVATVSEKLDVLDACGFDLLGVFVLPPSSWTRNYFEPTAARAASFLARHAGRPEAEAVVAMDRHEAALYERFCAWFGYAFYVARKR